MLLLAAAAGAVWSVVDPARAVWVVVSVLAELHGFGGAPIASSAQAVYTVGFLLFWTVTSMATAITALLLLAPAELNSHGQPSRTNR